MVLKELMNELRRKGDCTVMLADADSNPICITYTAWFGTFPYRNCNVIDWKEFGSSQADYFIMVDDWGLYDDET